MPLYDYEREDGKIITLQRRMNDPEFKKCPETGQELRRIYNPAWGMVRANTLDGSKFEGKKFISQKYADSIRKRKHKKSEETIAEMRGEI